MRDIALVTDGDLARARVDPEFRHRLVADNLERLISELNRLRSRSGEASGARQLREGVDLAVQLAELLHRIQRPAADADSERGPLTTGISAADAGHALFEPHENGPKSGEKTCSFSAGTSP